MSRLSVDAVALPYRGVLIDRPCVHCDTTSFHMDGYCQDGPCVICGVNRHVDNYASHPATIDGIWRGSYSQPLHDWTPFSYWPADFTEGLPAFEAIIDRCREIGWPLRYTSDVFRDYQSIVAQGEGARFIWIIRPGGTHMITSGLGYRGSLGYLRKNEPEARVFYWNGFTLDETDWDTALCLLAAVAINPPVSA